MEPKTETKEHSSRAASTQVSLEPYLRSVYEPEADCVDGELQQRNVGEFDHSVLQQQIMMWFYARERESGEFA
jgi:hypothetical protein